MIDLLTYFPKAKDCVNGHIGEDIETVEQEAADDRYYEVKFTRCSHCNMPTSAGDYL